MTTAMDWLDAHVERTLTAQANASNNSKLVVTFATGVVVGVLVPALQKDEAPVASETVAMVAALLAGLGVLAVFALDRVRQPDVDAVTKAHARDPAALLDGLRRAALQAVETNKQFVRAQWFAAVTQALLAAVSIVASVSVLL